MENDDVNAKDNSNAIIDTINNNINCLIERLQSECEESKVVTACDESSLPSPKAMLDTIMPCEKLCNNFRHIADDLNSNDSDNVMKTQIKSEPTTNCINNNNNEPKLLLAHDDVHENVNSVESQSVEQFPLNLKHLKSSIFGTNHPHMHQQTQHQQSNNERNKGGHFNVSEKFII
jgi:hypothetical protein